MQGSGRAGTVCSGDVVDGTTHLLTALLDDRNTDAGPVPFDRIGLDPNLIREAVRQSLSTI
jgi:hypothetical protein